MYHPLSTKQLYLRSDIFTTICMSSYLRITNTRIVYSKFNIKKNTTVKNIFVSDLMILTNNSGCISLHKYSDVCETSELPLNETQI